MNSFLLEEELKRIGFASIGQNVLLSKKASIYAPNNISIGNNVRIDDFCILSGKIILGDYIHISAHTSLFAGTAGIEMLDFSTISSKCSVYAESDDYSGMALANPMIPDEYRMVKKQRVLIKKHALIGAGCIVLPGVTIEEGSSFGAMTLINKDSEPWSINIGIPSRKIGERSKRILDLEEQLMKELRMKN